MIINALQKAGMFKHAATESGAPNCLQGDQGIQWLEENVRIIPSTPNRFCSCIQLPPFLVPVEILPCSRIVSTVLQRVVVVPFFSVLLLYRSSACCCCTVLQRVVVVPFFSVGPATLSNCHVCCRMVMRRCVQSKIIAAAPSASPDIDSAPFSYDCRLWRMLDIKRKIPRRSLMQQRVADIFSTAQNELQKLPAVDEFADSHIIRAAHMVRDVRQCLVLLLVLSSLCCCS
jgi:hypothetical protein